MKHVVARVDTLKGKNVGVIQCKQVNKNISKPAVLKEILKFLVHYTQDNSLITDVNNFTYYFAVSKGFAETASVFLTNFNNNYNENEVKNICEKILKEYISLNHVLYTDIASTIKSIFLTLKVEPIIPADMNKYLWEHETLIKNFFRILTVTDNTLLEGIIEGYLTPILTKLYPKGHKDYKDFTYRFKEYLQRAYSYYSSSRTLLFGNQQKKLEDFYYPLEIECSLDSEEANTISINTFKYEDDFLPYFKKAIIVDNGGMGKSTIMKWIFLSVIKERKGIPIFIELRKLTNGRTIIDEIIRELNPIDEQIEKEIITNLIQQGGFVFFFDGYDEIVPEDRSFVTTDLQSFISKSERNLFVMTSRPEIALNAFSDFKEFKIKTLKKEDAFELIKKIGNNSDKSQRLIKKLKEKKFEKIEDFLKSPLLVSLLFKKFEHRENIPIKLQEFYYEVFEALFQDHDLTKGESYIRPKKSKLVFSEFFQVLRELAFLTFKKGEIEYNDAVLNNYINEVSKQLPNIKIKPADFIEDLVKNVPLFSKEGLEYKWAHKSFQEYFTAEFICRDTKDKQIEVLQSMYNSRKFEKYTFILKLCYDIDYKSIRESIIIPYLKGYINFYETVLNDTSIHEKITEDQLDLFKNLIFNKAYLIKFIGNKKDSFLEEAYNYITKDSEEILNKYPSFTLTDHKASALSFGDDQMVIISIKYNDLLDFLIDKKASFIKSYSPKKHNRDFKKTLNKISKSGPIVINIDNIDLSNFELFEYYLETLSRFFPNRAEWFLDFKKCKKYVSDYDKFTLEKNNYDLTNGL